MELTIESIQADIDSFNARISEAQQRLSTLPSTSNKLEATQAHWHPAQPVDE